MSKWKIFLKKLRKELLFLTPLRTVFLFKYELMQTPKQLIHILQLLEETKDVEGDVVEVGVGYGHTTVFMNKLLDELKVEKKFLCIDTFSGFEKKDIAFEGQYRGKDEKQFYAFQVNSKKWFDKMMHMNRIKRVESFVQDASTFEFKNPVSFCLLDVDIYVPTKNVLEHIWPKLSPGGIIMIDDCHPNNIFDGSLQAYDEFVKAHSLPREIVEGHGVIRKAQ